MAFVLSRRDFVRYGTASAAVAAVPGRPWGIPQFTQDTARLDALSIPLDSDLPETLAQRAVDAARSAGATYADVRLTRTVTQLLQQSNNRIIGGKIEDHEDFAIGVRTLVNGYWGFAASPYWSPDEVIRLATSAVAQAKTNALGSPRVVEWHPVPAVKGRWQTPGVDPFTISAEEKRDVVNAWRQAVLETPKPNYMTARLETAYFTFVRQERYMASTEGTSITQTLYTIGGRLPFMMEPKDSRAPATAGPVNLLVEGLHAQRMGWDGLLRADIPTQLPRLFEQGAELSVTPHKPIDIGKYEVVCDAETVAAVMAATIGKATQLDRALGFEANSGGTSYLGPNPLELLGTFKAAAPIVTISANRSLPNGAATVQWDDEGVSPDDFSLIQEGVLVDYQTTREQAAWLTPWYKECQRPIRSHGCADAPSAMEFPLQSTPNLVLHPAPTDASFESLVAGVSKGLAIYRGQLSTDFQAKTVMGRGLVREIVDGKLGKICEGAGYLFNSSEFWNNISALGGASSIHISEGADLKGEPEQRHLFGVSAVPAVVKNLSVIDYRRRA